MCCPLDCFLRVCCGLASIPCPEAECSLWVHCVNFITHATLCLERTRQRAGEDVENPLNFSELVNCRRKAEELLQVTVCTSWSGNIEAKYLGLWFGDENKDGQVL